MIEIFSLVHMELEFARTAGGLHGKLVLVLLLYEAGVDELRHQVGSDFAGLVILLQLKYLLLQLLDLRLLG